MTKKAFKFFQNVVKMKSMMSVSEFDVEVLSQLDKSRYFLNQRLLHDVRLLALSLVIPEIY